MGSVGNQNPWPPYNNNNIDCSQGICTIYCPHLCYFFFPPPAPAPEDGSSTLSPLIIALIGVLASAFLLVSYYAVVTRYCKRRPSRIDEHADDHSVIGQIAREQWRAGNGGLDESVIRTIRVRKYAKNDKLIEGTDCAVCLSEFREDEPLRILPKCGHAFHVPCIDTWLRSQSNCPLCRALIAPAADEFVVAVDDDRDGYVWGEQVVVLRVSNDDNGDDDGNENAEDIETRSENYNIENNDDGAVKRLRRSMSLGTFTLRRHLSISDDDDVGSSKGDDGMKRCASSGGLMFNAVHGRGKSYNCVLPN